MSATAVPTPLTSSWVRVALAGQSVIISNPGVAVVSWETASFQPPASEGGSPLLSGANLEMSLTADLWARCPYLNGSIVVDAGASKATSGSGYTASGKTPVTGAFTGIGTSASFSPLAGRLFNTAIWGTFQGGVQLERSFDGTNWLTVISGVTVVGQFTSPASQAFSDDEVGVLYRLNCTAWTSGTINYRLSQ